MGFSFTSTVWLVLCSGAGCAFEALWSASESGPIGDGPDVSDTDVEITQSKNHGLTYQQSALLDSSDMDKTKTSQYMSGGFHLDRH